MGPWNVIIGQGEGGKGRRGDGEKGRRGERTEKGKKEKIRRFVALWVLLDPKGEGGREEGRIERERDLRLWCGQTVINQGLGMCVCACLCAWVCLCVYV